MKKRKYDKYSKPKINISKIKTLCFNDKIRLDDFSLLVGNCGQSETVTYCNYCAS